MTSVIQLLRSAVSGKRPTAAPVGAVYTNFADRQIGVVDAANAAIDLVGVRFFSATANYQPGDVVQHNAELYRAKAAITAGAFDATKWGVYAREDRTNTFTVPQVIDANDATNPALRVTQKGAGAALLVEDEANPDASPFIVDASGNVGIGVSPPYAGFKLHIKATTGSGVLISGGQQNNLMFSSAGTVGGFVMGRSYTVNDAQNFFIRDETATALRMFIASNGNVGFGGTQDPQKEVDIVGGLRVMQNLPATSGAIVIRANIGNTVGGHIQFVDNGATAQLGFIRFNTSGDFNLGNTGQSFAVLQNGTIQSPQTYVNTGAGTSIAVASTGEFYRVSSSLKYKKDIEALDPVLTDRVVAGLRPVWYRTKNPIGDDKADWSHIGLIAEEVAKVEPRLVDYKTKEVSTDDDGNQVVTELETPIPEGVDYARLSVLLLDAVQRLRKEFDAYKAAHP